nr:MAG TPA: hypothetical protein [Caudoviricetes sp.]
MCRLLTQQSHCRTVISVTVALSFLLLRNQK